MGSLTFEGIISIVAGLVAFLVPGITALALLILIAACAITNGIIEIVAAIRLRKIIKHEWLLVLAGLASLAFGIILLLAPLAGALVLVWWIAAFAMVFGVLLMGLAFRMRKGNGFATPEIATV